MIRPNNADPKTNQHVERIVKSNFDVPFTIEQHIWLDPATGNPIEHNLAWNRHMNLSISKTAIQELIWILSPKKNTIVAVFRVESDVSGMLGFMHGGFSFMCLDMVLGTCASRYSGGPAMTRVATTTYRKAAKVPGTFVIVGRLTGESGGQNGVKKTLEVTGRLFDWAEWSRSLMEGKGQEPPFFVEGKISFTVVDPNRFKSSMF